MMPTTIHTEIDVDTSRFFPDAEIPGLAVYGLSRIPGYRRNADGEEDESWRVEWFETRDRILEVRDRIWRTARRNPIFAAGERQAAYACPHYFKAVYGWIAEPRQRAGMFEDNPFVPFAYQIHITNHKLALCAREEEIDLWQPKARGLGVSWNNQHDETWDWLRGPARWILSSRNETLVGDIDNPDAMFGKVFYLLRRLPPWLLPAGFDPDAPRGWWNTTRMTLTNKDKDSPGYGAQLVGSPTTKNIGRAGRYKGADVDEGQAIARLNSVIQSLRGSTFHIVVTGTEGTDEGEDFVDGWQSAKRENPETVLELNYHQNAFQDRAWLERQYARATTPQQKAALALEYERNYFAGYSDWIYPEARHIAEDDRPYRPDAPLDTTFDPGKDDETAVLAAQPTVRAGVPGFHVLFTYEKQITNVEWFAHVFTGIWPQQGRDSCYGIEPDHEEQAIGAFYYQRWLQGSETRWFMDPAGIASQSNASFWSTLRDKSAELRQREIEERLLPQAKIDQIVREEGGEREATLRLPEPWGITCLYEIIRRHRLHEDRHYALRKYLPAVTIQRGVRSAMRFKVCLMRYQFNPRSPKAITEAKPLHNQYSHLASSGEYYAVYYVYGFVDPPQVARSSGPGPRRIPSSGPGRAAIPATYPTRGAARPAPPPDRGYRRLPASSATGRWR